MPIVNEFEVLLHKKCKAKFGTWFKVDLHNHSPKSFDYTGSGDQIVELISEKIRSNELSVVMFADHGQLPEKSFIDKVSELSGALIIRGVELNMFVDVLDKPQNKVTKDYYYHVLVGFDPDGQNPPDYWCTEIYRKCHMEERHIGDREIVGITANPQQLSEVLADSNAFIIPAHLHSVHNSSKSRSIDEVYDDPAFLKYAKSAFTALEVVKDSTAAFFDGTHTETNKLYKACIRSSDSHEPNTIGWRSSYVQMQIPSYKELKAGLELPFRTSVYKPPVPQGFVIGMHIRGAFLQDQWLSFSPHCNVLIGVKGAGKTSVLECLRFALGATVPKSRQETVSSHLNAILGPSGIVTVLVKRPDGAKILVERSVTDKKFNITFEDDRCETLSSPEGIHFPCTILGWHEIEQAATDPNIRRVYMDIIAGKSKIQTLENDAHTAANRIKEKHTLASQRHGVYRDLDSQAKQLEELRKGLQKLSDANLIELRDKYVTAVDQREMILHTIQSLEEAKSKSVSQVEKVLAGQQRNILSDSSPLSAVLKPTQDALTQMFNIVEAKATEVEAAIDTAIVQIKAESIKIEEAFNKFVQEYTEQIKSLSPEQRNLLEKHREVVEQTKALAGLQKQREDAKQELLADLNDLTNLCDQLAGYLDERTRIRKTAVEQLNGELVPFGVRISVLAQQQSNDFQELSAKYAKGANALNQLRSKLPDRLSHLSLKRAYGSMYSDLEIEYAPLLFDSTELGYLLSVFENDDLLVELKVGRPGEEYASIDRLSSGQRCTAIFPILLKLGQGALIIDQPEDNLDNRHIASFIAPFLLEDKKARQMVFTSHNANLVVLSDAESIMLFESDGTSGWLQEHGFLATRSSPITKHVIDILDGGDKALELRALKYGLK